VLQPSSFCRVWPHISHTSYFFHSAPQVFVAALCVWAKIKHDRSMSSVSAALSPILSLVPTFPCRNPASRPKKSDPQIFKFSRMSSNIDAETQCMRVNILRIWCSSALCQSLAVNSLDAS
jgi:hypothetical protein